MRVGLALALLGSLGELLALPSCTRADLDAITHAPATDGGSGNEDGDGGTGTVSCPSSVLSPGDTNRTVGSTTRGYLLHVPATYDGRKPVPLVLDFHAQNGTGKLERMVSPYPAQTDPDGVIMAFPNGLPGPSGTAWNVGPCCVADVDDVAFARAVVAQIQKEACIDPKRIYAVGTATGGGMAQYLACQAADLFAAIAPAAFDLLEENVKECLPSRPITVISFRGTADPLIPYEGGYSPVVTGMPVTFLGALATFEKWAELDGCTGAPSAMDSDGCSTYSACKEGAQVTLCTKKNGGLDAGNAAIAWPLLRGHAL